MKGDGRSTRQYWVKVGTCINIIFYFNINIMTLNHRAPGSNPGGDTLKESDDVRLFFLLRRLGGYEVMRLLLLSRRLVSWRAGMSASRSNQPKDRLRQYSPYPGPVFWYMGSDLMGPSSSLFSLYFPCCYLESGKLFYDKGRL